MTHPTRRAPAFPPYTPDVAAPAAPAWSPARRVAFRFFCVWAVATVAPWPLDAIPGAAGLLGWYRDGWAAAYRWVGAHVLHTAAPAVAHPNGAGDKTVAWVAAFCALVLAGVGAALWSARARGRLAHPVAYERLRTYVRWYVGADMLGYGMYKILPTQFPAPALFRYVEPYGEFSPMSVLWTMMGHSTLYNVFAGGAEVLGALLLFWRRTTSAGALLLLGAMANVTALNFAFDVTVKLHSLTLLALCGFLLLPDARRLWAAVVLQRAVPARDVGATTLPPRVVRWQRVVTPVAVAAMTALVAFDVYGLWSSRRGPGHPAAGIWEVEGFVRNGVAHPPLTTDPVRWRRLIVEKANRVTVQVMSDSLRRFRLEGEPGVPLLSFVSVEDSTLRGMLAVTPEGAGARATGTFGGDSLDLRLRRVDPEQFTLRRRRGLHWVQDDNFQR
ncbi:hypothetical protein [Roseisolibacter sp. H3M3-2]|uniref:hypothetical protein n=1 Tax=Roseisolibacter sp. H3M3-2 TaxID=3031323 RepID=UPI0023D9DA38|nr:hypothetical protein [Roseisolibacter sp. H3M3-2]MDF1503121.1 hypothetical protein [Roseisolibacter sp. H3M3-2]